MDLGGKVVLITGGTRGIGKAIAIEYAKNGALIILNYKENDEKAKETYEYIRGMGNYIEIVKGDVGNYDFARELIEFTIKKFGKLDILINNAGISKIGLFIDESEEQWEKIINTNLKSVFNTCHNAVKHMISRKKGTIINISSIWGETGAACEVLYSASKGGVNSFTKALAKELGPSNITVNAIAPGVIDTEMNQWLSEEEKNGLKEEIPMMKFGKAEDVAKLAVFLANNNYITGKIITVDGGLI